MFTVAREFDQAINHVNQMSSGGSYVACFTLRLTPASTAEVDFQVSADVPEAQPWIPFIEEGVRKFIQQRKEESKAVGYFRVTLSDIWIHEIDSKQSRFVQAAEMAMSRAFSNPELIIER